MPQLLSASIPLTDNLSYPVYRLFMSGVCIALAIGLYLLISKTRLGMKIRAGAFNHEMTEALGVNVKLIHAVVFALGVGLASIAGMIASPISSVYPNMGSQVLIMCFVVVVIGGIGSVRGALISALLVGLVDTFGKVLLPQVAGMLVYMLMAAVLLESPKGCSSNERRPIPPGNLPRGLQVALALGFVALAAFPFVATDFYAQMVARMMILAIFAMSLDLLQGVTGLVSLGHAAFFGLAGYALAFLTPPGAP